MKRLNIIMAVIIVIAVITFAVVAFPAVAHNIINDILNKN